MEIYVFVGVEGVNGLSKIVINSIFFLVLKPLWDFNDKLRFLSLNN